MITTCTGCQARYRLVDDRVPWRKVRVRCPNCRTVFTLDGTVREQVVEQPAATQVIDAVGTVAGLEAFPFGATSAPAPADDAAAPEIAATPRPAPAPLPASPPAPPPAPAAARPAATRPAAPPAAPSPAAQPAARVDGPVAVAEAPRVRRPRREKEEMLARALVSDILVYNREARDRALADGTLLEVLGPEIKKSWELYKEKVGAEAATQTAYFKDALNEILADGQRIF